jgi:hypothetical protein
MNIAQQLFEKAEIVTKQRNETRSQEHFEKLVKQATDLAADGRYYLDVETLLPETKEKLLTAGFHVKYEPGMQYSSSSFTIDWDFAKK